MRGTLCKHLLRSGHGGLFARRQMSFSTGTVCVVGSVCVDSFIEVPRLPKPGETLAGSPLSGNLMPGGKGANQAAGASMLGARSVFSAQVGADSAADYLADELNSRKVDLSLMERSEGVPTGKAYIFLEPNGSNSIVIIQGANVVGWGDALPSATKDAISSASVLMLQREIPDEVNLEAATVANKAGVPVVYDVGGKDEPIDSSICPLLYIVWPNETELANITGMPTDTEDQIAAAVKSLQSSGVTEVLVTLGEKGSRFFKADGSLISQDRLKIDAESVIDTTGAGDCFRAAFSVAYFCEQRSVEASLTFAAAASGLLIQRMGAMSVPTKAETLDLLNAFDIQL